MPVHGRLELRHGVRRDLAAFEQLLKDRAGRHEHRAALAHRLGRLLVEERSVLDGVAPASSAAIMPGLPSQWAATIRSLIAATSTIARISATVNCWWIGWSTSLNTPPDA